jgi:hypothetical protein
MKVLHLLRTVQLRVLIMAFRRAVTVSEPPPHVRETLPRTGAAPSGTLDLRRVGVHSGARFCPSLRTNSSKSLAVTIRVPSKETGKCFRLPVTR